MTVLSQIVSIVRSGVFHVVYLDASSRRLGSGTAFMSKGLLVTNGHLLELPPSTTDIWLRQDHHRHQNEGICLRKEDFINRMLFASPPEEYDYAALEIPELIASSTPYQFKITKPTTKMIGEDVAFLGYPLEHSNMSCHAGIISSLYESNRVSVIQINASVNSSNSGGPLFDPSNGQVIGIVTRKATGLTNMFDEMKKAVQANIKFVESGSDNVRLSGISFRASLVSQQRQMLSTLEQIERSANVGIGYAFSTEHLLEEPRFTERNG